jgi:hypothetical protein
MMMEAENYYDVLGIRPGADDDQVKHAYRELAKTLHPDRNPGNEIAERRFKLVSTAYEALKDAGRRQSYNEFLSFNEGREKSQKRQWGRLIALVALLLLGPSAVLVGVFGFGSGTLFGGLKTEETANRSAPPPTQIERPVANAEIEGDKPEAREIPAVEVDAAESTEEGAGSEPSAGPASEQELVKADEPVESRSEPDPTPEPAETVRQPETAAVSPEEAASDAPPDPGPPVAEVTPDGNLPVVEPDLAAETGAARDTPIPAAPEAPVAGAQATAPVEPAPETAPRIDEPIAPIASEYTNTGPDALEQQPPEAEFADDGSPQITLPERRPDGGSRADDTTIESARRLAQLKEPDAVPPVSERDVAAVPSANADVFSDCGACPRMFVAPRSESAVSLSEITVGEWKACVDDGVCAPYRRFGGDSNARVVGLNAANASAYTEWLTALTGQTYRVVMTRKPRTTVEGPTLEAAGDCEPDSSRSGGDEWQWLEENNAQRKCPPGSAAQAPQAVEGGFRVSRSIGRQG